MNWPHISKIGISCSSEMTNIHLFRCWILCVFNVKLELSFNIKKYTIGFKLVIHESHNKERNIKNRLKKNIDKVMSKFQFDSTSIFVNTSYLNTRSKTRFQCELIRFNLKRYNYSLYVVQSYSILCMIYNCKNNVLWVIRLDTWNICWIKFCHFLS